MNLKQLLDDNPKFKEAFEEWYHEGAKNRIGRDYNNWRISQFFPLPFNMQYGVLVDFFDSELIKIRLEYWNMRIYYQWTIRLHFLEDVRDMRMTGTRHEVREVAITKAVEIFENR